jgi:hypothetical protein
MLLLALSVLMVQAQTSTVTGKVTDSKNAPLEGVSVTIKGTTRGTTTNAAGSFSLSNVPLNAALIFSYTGLPPVKNG